MHLARFPRRRHTEGATPMERLARLSGQIGGPEIRIKRDDLLGFFPGRNKTRKLEFLMADALAKGADAVITCGNGQRVLFIHTGGIPALFHCQKYFNPELFRDREAR